MGWEEGRQKERMMMKGVHGREEGYLFPAPHPGPGPHSLLRSVLVDFDHRQRRKVFVLRPLWFEMR